MFSPRLCHNLLKLESSSCFCLPSPAVNFWDIVLRQEIQQVDAGFRQQIHLIHIFTEIKKKQKPDNFLTYSELILTDWPLSAGVPELISISSTQPDSGKHPSPLETMILSGKHKHTLTKRKIYGYPIQSHPSISSVWVSLFCLLSMQQFSRENNNAECSDKAAHLCVQNKQSP